ncbi:MAG TPA: heparan-alpha-glucosaminide N-acetyltransferase domain-containing protein [Opitutaceae bacterium]|nr:heparan-alpha-glucosaminide N-acetyltransferase domain-containing protein [Opitutaceae bacterium]
MNSIPTRPEGTPRIVSLDAVRGFDMFWIVGGAPVFRALAALAPRPVEDAVATQLEHTAWRGLHFYDLIFPLFLFLVGVGAALSLDKLIAQRGVATAVRRVVRRAVILYVLGVVYDGGLALGWDRVRWIGVLQEIAACYLVAGLLYCGAKRRLAVVAAAVPVMLLAHWALLRFVPFPDLTVTPEGLAPFIHRLGTTDPATIAAAAPGMTRGVFEHGRNLANYLDFRFLPGKKPEPYFAWEGLLSPLSATTLCLIGILCGRLLLDDAIPPPRKVALLLGGGVLLVAAGLGWSLEMPLVKKLWASSFCLVGAGYGAAVLGLFYWVMDVKKVGRGIAAPWIWIGANPITLYVASGIVPFTPLAKRIIGPEVQRWLDSCARGGADLAVCLVAFVLLLAFARLLYVKRIFLRL